MAGETARRLACDASVLTVVETPEGQVLDVGRRTRKIPRPLRRALRRRDGHCQFPGCDRARTQAHHVQHWIDGGHTRLDNLLSLCSRCHHRLHEGGYRLRYDEDGQLHFHHPAGYELPSSPVIGPVKPGDGQYDQIPPFSSGWSGDPFDLGLTVDCILQHEHPDDSSSGPIDQGYTDAA